MDDAIYSTTWVGKAFTLKKSFTNSITTMVESKMKW